MLIKGVTVHKIHGSIQYSGVTVRYSKKKEMPDKLIIQELNTVQNSPMALFRITFVVEIAQKLAS